MTASTSSPTVRALPSTFRRDHHPVVFGVPAVWRLGHRPMSAMPG